MASMRKTRPLPVSGGSFGLRSAMTAVVSEAASADCDDFFFGGKTQILAEGGRKSSVARLSENLRRALVDSGIMAKLRNVLGG
jgi:hypothetical protein